MKMMATLADLEILTLDCQATGANPEKGHLLEIGWLPTRASAADNSSMAGLRTYLVCLPDDAVIPHAVQRITGISNGHLSDAVSSKNIWEHLIQTTRTVTTGNLSSVCPLVIHFARFEEPFLRQLHQQHNLEEPFPFQIICTHEIAIRLLPDLPRRGLRAIAGFFGHSMPELKRSSDHVVATAFIWKKMVEILLSTRGISRLDQLTDWLASTKPPGRSKRTFPMNPEVHLQLPNKPGIYRMLRIKNGDPLYIGKAKSLKQRVKSYFRQKAPHAEHTLEMLTQAHDLDFTVTGSALEAAILESDEIKRLSPPYNIALRRRERELSFFSKDLCRDSAEVENDFPVGPIPTGRFSQTISAFGLWLKHGMQVIDHDHLNLAHSVLGLLPDYSPEIDCLRDGFNIFRENYRSRMLHSPQSALRFVTALGAQLWRQRLETVALEEIVEDKENGNGDMDTDKDESDQEHVWTPEAVAHSLENMVLHSSHLIRRARWFCLLSQSSLTWSSANQGDNVCRLVVFKNGSVHKRDYVNTGKKAPTPPGYKKSFLTRQKNMTLTTYDRLRVATTELRRLVSEGRTVELRLGPGVTLAHREIIKVLRWV
ncbi:MAG: GIY-YIG nuclease family protein [Desulfobacterales bacterium]|nr:GIY-YIG nuclease family protein [Desulfobacterales bacterium]